jgi:malate dehydrogenase
VPKIGLVGFGGIGIELAKALVNDPTIHSDIVAFDRKEAIETVPGPIMGAYHEINDAIGILEKRDTLTVTHDIKKLKGCDAIIFTAGLPRTADQSRADLIGVNIPIVGGICDKLKDACPDTFLIMVTNPLDAMVELAFRRLGFPPDRIVGQAGVLDTGRFTIQASLASGVPASQISTLVLGGHGPSMVPVYSQASVAGRPLSDVVASDKIEEITGEVRGRGAFIIRQQGRSAIFSTAVASIRMLKAYLFDTAELMAGCARLQGEYGYSDVFAGVPVEISAKGVRVVEIDLNDEEKAALANSVEKVNEVVAELDQAT